jgi:MFS family permease
MSKGRLRGVAGTAGLPRLLGCALVGELPNGMLGLAILLRITEAGGSYARGGLVSALSALGTGALAPGWSRLADRFGQTVVLVPTAAAVVAATSILAVLPPRGAIWPLLVLAVIAGACQPPAGVCARTLWPTVVTDPALLEATYGIESSMTELIFIIGPLLVVGISGLLGGSAAVVASGVLACAGAVGFATSPASRRFRPQLARLGEPPLPRQRALSSAGVRVLVLCVFAMVTGFAAIDVATVAAARQLSGNGTAGIMIAVWSVGSLGGGLVYGSRSWPGALSTRIIVLLAAIAVMTAALVPQSSLVALGIVLFVGGANYAPCFACINLVVQRSARAGAVTESYAWIGSGALLGASLGSAIGGVAISEHGFGAGYLVATVAVAIAVAVAIGFRGSLRDGEPVDG